ncbi:hypothetical protein BASA62_009856 [Batrachochytrium salamandrivorans]|nr:hypothetical protein BASA62_009856 [Batrachochytrium salamandrivorans]
MQSYEAIPGAEASLDATVSIIPDAPHGGSSCSSIRSLLNHSNSLNAPVEEAGEPKDFVRPGTASNNAALYHVICVIAGTGVLQVPYALMLSGWSGILLMLFAAVVNDYTGKMLIRCLYTRGHRVNGGYPEIGRLAYGIAGERVVQVFYTTILLGVTCLYLILAGLNLESLVGIFDQKQWIMICAIGVLIPFILMRSLKEVAIVSLFGALASVVVCIMVVALGLIEIPKNEGKVTHTFFNLAQMPAALGSFSFSFGGNYVYAEVERSMATPQAFPAVLSRAMSIITGMYLLTAVIGYAAFGNLTLSPILDNLPHGWATTASVVIITAHVLLACPLLVTTFSVDIERYLGLDAPEDTTQQRTQRTLLRTGLMVGIAVVAMAVPFFSDLMTFLGAVANTMLIFVFPVVFYYKIYGIQGRSRAELAFGGVIIAIGLLGGEHWWIRVTHGIVS